MASAANVNSIMRVVLGCDGYSMDLHECAEHFGVTADEIRRIVTATPNDLVLRRDDDGDETIAYED